MKKLGKLNLKSATLMDDNEMKMIVGGSGYTCHAQSSTCSGTTCFLSVGGIGTCKSVWIVNRFLCACEK
jgi:natural product precursor